MPESDRRVLGVFAKWPRAGAVKTRLADDPERCAAAARAFLLDTLTRLRGIAVRRVLVFAPLEARNEFAAIAAAYALEPQADGDLGRRLAAFFERQIATGATKVVAVGADSPTLPIEYVEQAFAELDRADVVLGPATDGGYYLIGCGPRRPPVFDGVAWGTGRVLADTVARLSDGWRLALLPPWYDVDTPADWQFLRGHVAALRRAGRDPGVPHTETLFQAATPPAAAPSPLVGEGRGGGQAPATPPP